MECRLRPHEFYGDETLLIFHENSVFSLLAMSAKLMIFNAMKSFIKLSLRLALAKQTPRYSIILHSKLVPHLN